MMKKFMTIAMMGAVVMTSCSVQEDVNVEGQWNIVTLNGKTVDTENIPYIGFDTEEGRIFGNSGCNYINGTFNLKDGNIIEFGNVGSTMMSCPDMQIEQEVLSTLEKVGKIKAEGEALSLCDAKGNQLIKLEKRFEEVAYSAIEGKWNMVKVEGEDIPSDLDGIPFLSFTADLNVAGLAGYNNVHGAVALDEADTTSIQFENMAATRKMGPNMEFEDNMMNVLGNIRSFGLLSNGHLALFDANGKLAIELEKAE